MSSSNSILRITFLLVLTAIFQSTLWADLETKNPRTAPKARDAESAWLKLVGAKMAKRDAFAFVKHNPNLPNVLIYGDSISIAYTPTVRAQLDGKANVYRVYCNGGDSGSLINKLSLMRKTMRNDSVDGRWHFKWDVIHFNVGLHDLKYVTDKRKLDRKHGKLVSTLETYESNLNKNVAFLKAFAPKAKLIFCTTTPVPENEPGRIAGSAVKYNDVALQVMDQHPGILINDLYSFTKPHQPKWWTKPGNVHFTKIGYTAQGKHVAAQILKALK